MGLAVQVNTDGGARGNPGPAAIGVVVREAGTSSMDVLTEISRTIGETTNNVAEYSAVIAGLEAAADLGADSVRLASDSELLVKQLQGAYRVKAAHLVPLYRRCRELLRGFDSVEIVHVRRELNVEADALVNQALDASLM
ncbi:MAG: ribonuclease HI family protein [Acidimicrobiia bacterium]|nr:ribonuclease HI family protein [Acidimicrobiia bacterium]